MKAADIDLFSTKTLDAGTELESAHPGFSDLAYRARRLEIVEKARAFRHGKRCASRSFRRAYLFDYLWDDEKMHTSG